MKPHPYTPEQIDIALGILSGRIDPETDLRTLDAAQPLYANTLQSAIWGGQGNPGPHAHRLKAEEILRTLLGV